jgi:hypothetical protein
MLVWCRDNIDIVVVKPEWRQIFVFMARVGRSHCDAPDYLQTLTQQQKFQSTLPGKVSEEQDVVESYKSSVRHHLVGMARRGQQILPEVIL